MLALLAFALVLRMTLSTNCGDMSAGDWEFTFVLLYVHARVSMLGVMANACH